ncbi:MAG: DEAD/DEAH box helicase [Armatimonadota bacterium]
MTDDRKRNVDPRAGTFDPAGFLREIQFSPNYRKQIVYVHIVPAREAVYAEPETSLSTASVGFMHCRGAARLYAHQARAVDLVLRGENVVVATGTTSGKSLCYLVPIVEMISRDPESRFLLMFPTKALCQDQLRSVRDALKAARLPARAAGVYDGNTPASERRRLRDSARVVLSNPDMVDAALMPQHATWAAFLGRLRYLVLDELHVYRGMFGSNMANLMRRFLRVCRHYGANPQIITCSGTIANPLELSERLTGRPFVLVDKDGSPRGRRTYVFWNPPQIRSSPSRSRRSANVEAHELMAELVRRGVPTIAFSKAKMTAEMIHRYVCENLLTTAPDLTPRVAAYRGGYLPEERREIERRLFNGELLGVSSTRALELGIDVSALDASILVGYPGTLASFFQQAGRAGRGSEDAMVVLVALDTPANQYIMRHPEYIFGRPIEQAVIDPDNPFVVINHLRCAAQELPLGDKDVELFGPHAGVALDVLQRSGRVRLIDGTWYHATHEIPQHQVNLRGQSDADVTTSDEETGEVIGTTTKLDAL